MFQVGSFVFGVITVMAAAPDVFNPKTLHIMKTLYVDVKKDEIVQLGGGDPFVQ